MLNPGQATRATFYNGYNYLLDIARDEEDLTLKFNELVVQLPNEEAQAKYRRKAETTLNLSRYHPIPKDIAEYQWRMSTPLATILLASDRRAAGSLCAKRVPLPQRFYCFASLHHPVLDGERSAHPY